ncbi:MAG TPA: hypothetical protein DEQ14_01910 [Treponema sp.]|nr:hypothetical protein [Treponema sp.]
MSMSLRSIGKLGFLLVLIGFLMPVACDMNGFDLADMFMEMDSAGNAVLLYGVFFLALAGLVIGALLIMNKSVPIAADWVILLACIGCGLGVYFGALSEDSVKLQSGAYMIVVGWAVVLVAQLISNVKKE